MRVLKAFEMSSVSGGKIIGPGSPGGGSPGTGSPGTGSPGTGSPGTGSPGQNPDTGGSNSSTGHLGINNLTNARNNSTFFDDGINDVLEDGGDIKFGETDKGVAEYHPLSHDIIIDSSLKPDNPSQKAQWANVVSALSHEIGHHEHPTPHQGSPAAFSDESKYVDVMMKSEGYALMENIKIQQQFIQNGKQTNLYLRGSPEVTHDLVDKFEEGVDKNWSEEKMASELGDILKDQIVDKKGHTYEEWAKDQWEEKHDVSLGGGLGGSDYNPNGPIVPDNTAHHSYLGDWSPFHRRGIVTIEPIQR